MEPTSTSAGTILLYKLASMLGGLFGGLSLSFFFQPKRLYQFGKLAAGAIIGGISVGASFALSGLVATQLGLDFNHIDVALGVGYAIGMISIGVIAWIANFLQKREEHDIIEVLQEMRGKSNTKPPAKRAPRKTGTSAAIGRSRK